MASKIRELWDNFKIDKVAPRLTGLEILKYIGPGLLVTVGFIDPGNWAANVAAGAEYGYQLLWMVTLSTIMLIFLQHNAAHLGIASGLCLSEAATKHLRPAASRMLLGTAVLAAVATAFAEILGGAIALRMLFHLPLQLGALLTGAFVAWLLYSNSYRRLEKIIIGFVSLIGIAFIFEISLAKVDWAASGLGWVTPAFPLGSMPIIMSVLGAVVMPHNLFLHSEIIQSRQWQLEGEGVIKKRLKYEFLDTLFSMGAGWAINSAMIIVAAATFYIHKMPVSELEQATELLVPLLGKSASLVFALALLCAGIASSVTAGMAGGSIFAGIFGEPYDIADKHSRVGVGLTLGLGIVLVFLISDPFRGLIVSQMALSIQLPLTIFLLIYLTSTEKVMGAYKNKGLGKSILWIIGALVTWLNLRLFLDMLS
ncbi:MAG: Mg2+/Co2+ transporter [Lentisphaerae bacterium GWF2_52_8]|nr:MAG: Mg2+/Co2+ transporter [Lentisphaerae bacterium GWF2_52_8]